MSSFAYVALLSSVVSLVEGFSFTSSSVNVTVRQDNTTRPCDEKVLVFALTVAPGKRNDYDFRLDCTCVLYMAQSPNSTETWSAPIPNVTFNNVTSFFRGVEKFMTESPLNNVSTAPIQLEYRFDTFSGNYNFSLLTGEESLISYVKNEKNEIRNVSESAKEHNGTLSPYLKGPMIELLNASRDHLDLERKIIYNFTQERDRDRTDSYELYRRNDTIICTMTSDAPWYRTFFFNGRPVNTTQTGYNNQDGTYTTVATMVRTYEENITCTITFPNGATATLNISLPRTDPESKTLPNTPSSVAATVQTTPMIEHDTETPASASTFLDTTAARTVPTTAKQTTVPGLRISRTPDAATSSDTRIDPPTTRTTDSGIDEDEATAAERSSLGTGSTAAIVIVVAVIILIVSALMVHRRRRRSSMKESKDIL